MLNSAKERIAIMLNLALARGMNESLREKLALEVQQGISQQVRPLLLRKVRSGQFSLTDVEDICQSTAAAFIVAAESGRIRPSQPGGSFDAQVVGRYLHGIAVHKLADLRRELGYREPLHGTLLQKIAGATNELIRENIRIEQSPPDKQDAALTELDELLSSYLTAALSNRASTEPQQRLLAINKLKSAYVSGVRAGQLGPRKRDFGLVTPQRVGEVLADLALKAGLQISASALPSAVASPPTAVTEALLSEFADTRVSEHEADERLWQQLREVSSDCNAQDIIFAYLSFSGASHKAIAQCSGVHINTVTNSVRRVVLELRRIMHSSGRGVS